MTNRGGENAGFSFVIIYPGHDQSVRALRLARFVFDDLRAARQRVSSGENLHVVIVFFANRRPIRQASGDGVRLVGERNGNRFLPIRKTDFLKFHILAG